MMNISISLHCILMFWEITNKIMFYGCHNCIHNTMAKLNYVNMFHKVEDGKSNTVRLYPFTLEYALLTLVILASRNLSR